MKKSHFIHLTIWLTGYVTISLPNFDLTVGAFHGSDSSLLITATYGTMCNAAVFYGNANYLLPLLLKQRMVVKYLTWTLGGFLIIGLFESLLDLAFFSLYYDAELTNAVYNEVIIGNYLSHFIFFLIPSYLYRFTTDWIKSSSTDGNIAHTHTPLLTETIVVKSGSTIHQILLEKLSHIESDGNYINYYYDGKKLLSRDSLSKALTTLPKQQFIRCHKSYIISKRFTQKIDYDFVYFKDQKFPIGRAYRKGVIDFYQS